MKHIVIQSHISRAKNKFVVVSALIVILLMFILHNRVRSEEEARQTFLWNNIDLFRNEKPTDSTDLYKSVQTKPSRKDEGGEEGDVGDEVAELSQSFLHTSLYPDNLRLINLEPFKLTINQDICNISDIALVTIVHSAVQNTAARSIIRETWGNPKLPNVNTRLVFVVGEPEDPTKQEALKHEAFQFGDIVQGGFLDTYHNLSYKNVFGKLWVSHFCEQAQFVVKTDDDMFIDLYETYHITRQYLSHPGYAADSFLLCPVFVNGPILRDPDSKWYVSYEDITRDEAPDNVYPPYCSGWVYIFSPGTAKRLAREAETTKFFWIDDAWVTGIIAKKLELTHIDMHEFFMMESRKMIFTKMIQTPEDYHPDYLAAPTERNFEIAYTLHKHAEWCFREKCRNNIYYPAKKLTEVDLIPEKLISQFKLTRVIYKDGIIVELS